MVVDGEESRGVVGSNFGFYNEWNLEMETEEKMGG